MKKGPETIDSLRADLDDAHKEIAWLRQCIYGSAKVAKLEEEIKGLKKQVAYWKDKHETPRKDVCENLAGDIHH